MITLRKIILCSFLLCFRGFFLAKADTTEIVPDKQVKDWQKEKRREKIFGNTFHVTTGYTFCNNNYFDFGLGRSYVVGFGMGATYHAYGISYGKQTNPNSFNDLTSIYTEAGIVTILGGLTFRAEYIIDWTDKQHYFKPSVGLNFILFDFLYNYNFNFSGGENDYRHGFSIRMKICFPFDNYESGYNPQVPPYME